MEVYPRDGGKGKNEKALGRAMAERKDNRSSTGRQNIPKDPQRITFSHAGTTDGEKSRKTPTAEVPTINEEVPWPCLIFLCSARQCVTANKRMATIGGANTHSRPDRLSFVTSFTLSNDTHCFWTHSYANRPSTWHRLALLFPFFRVRLSSSRSRLCLSAPRRVTRPFSSALPSFRRYHRASRFFFHGARAGETVEFDLLGLKDPTMIGPSLPETSGEQQSSFLYYARRRIFVEGLLWNWHCDKSV